MGGKGLKKIRRERDGEWWNGSIGSAWESTASDSRTLPSTARKRAPRIGCRAAGCGAPPIRSCGRPPSPSRSSSLRPSRTPLSPPTRVPFRCILVIVTAAPVNGETDASSKQTKHQIQVIKTRNHLEIVAEEEGGAVAVAEVD